MWQMTLDEFENESFEPYEKDCGRANGITDWFCPVCRQCVGMYSDGSVHNKGWLYKRSRCSNGHRMEWK